MTKNYKLKFVLFFVLIGPASALSQNVDAMLKSDLLKGAGGVSINQVFNYATGKNPSRQPYSYLFSGNLQFQILGVINAPFNFTYSNLGSQLTQPTYNQTSIHPSYKWITVHAGTISCNYSGYTVNGHLFNGGALELTPGKLSFNAFYGRLQKKIPNTPELISQNILPAFQRMGGGCKIGYKDQSIGAINMVLFTASDDVRSLNVMDMPYPLQPKQNHCGSLNYQKTFKKKLEFNGEASVSIFNENKNNQLVNDRMPRFFDANTSTGIYKAFKSSLSYKINNYGLQLGYERIDPFYKTLGAYYFTSDLENITATFSAKVFKQKVNLNSTIGKQRDNLQKTKLNTMGRLVTNTSINCLLKKGITFTANYSNFLSYTNTRPVNDFQNQNNPYMMLDTLKFRQVSRNLMGNINVILHSDSLSTASILAMITVQTSSDLRNEVLINSNTFYNGNLGYSYQRKKSGEMFILSMNGNQSTINDIKVLSISPVLCFGKPMFKKRLRPSVAFNYTGSFIKGAHAGGVFNLRILAAYTVKKVHSFSVSFLLLNRKDSPTTNPYESSMLFNEITFMLNYAVSVDLFTIKRRKI
ncbi:MAG: hypothetical protein V4613_00230 [Bacteroidota bacterium]